jgi:DNA-binding CsgD family transcriptional regulator
MSDLLDKLVESPRALEWWSELQRPSAPLIPGSVWSASDGEQTSEDSSLIGREGELSGLIELVTPPYAQSRALVILGEPGMGKTVMLAEAALKARSAGVRVLTAADRQSEECLAFAGLHQLLRPALGQVAGLPARQAEALGSTFAVSGDPGPADALLAGTAVLSLLFALSDESPLLVVVDDAQWLDRATLDALAFVARRLESERLVLLVGASGNMPPEGLELDLQPLLLPPLSMPDAGRLLDRQPRPPRGRAREHAIADLAAAAARAERHLEARTQVERALALLDPTPGPRMDQLVARARALLAGPADAEQYFAEPLSHPAGSTWPFERAQLQLDYGEWLRRQRRINDAKPVLAAALETFRRLGAAPWIRRAEAELRACGVAAQARLAAPAALDRLTAQQREIAILAGHGLTNGENAGRLFLSPRTVASHLYRSSPKLGISGRHQLRDLIDRTDEPQAGDQWLSKPATASTVQIPPGKVRGEEDADTADPSASPAR